MLPLSQSHLTLLDTCPRKYQYVFFDALSAPTSYEQHIQAQWGSQFHMLMQQQALSLPAMRVATADAEMAASLQAMVQAAPDVFAHLPAPEEIAPQNSTTTFSQSEHRRTLEFNGYLLTVVYDLLVLKTENNVQTGQLFDWKTHQQPPKREWLQTDWQTRLYQYVLKETTDLL
ncbi:MAG: PD-(D/E)XK nuclease family protein, partial [Cyanobacteria bacterium J06632_3]